MIYISTTEAAKMIRAALKTKFPNTKFSVRSSKYAGGSSIRVEWHDGPTASEVDQIVKPYEGQGFDGMIDMSYSKTAYRLPDGSLVFGRSEGTEGSRGSVPRVEREKPEGAEEVRSHVDHVFTERTYSTEALKDALKEVADKFGADLKAMGVFIRETDYGPAIVNSDKNVFGENVWEPHWTFGVQTREVLNGKNLVK